MMEDILKFPDFPLPFIPSRQGRGQQLLIRGRVDASGRIVSDHEDLCYTVPIFVPGE
jgi:hypothetical protein